MKMVINDDFGGFRLSHKAILRYAEIKGMKLTYSIDDITKNIWKENATIDNPEIHKWLHYTIIGGEAFCDMDIPRNDPVLIQVVEELGKEANGDCASLKIVEIVS